MRVLVACEFSGIVREAFRAKGHDAYSVDLLNTELPGAHIRADIRGLLSSKWDLMVAFPPCTALALSGNRWYTNSQEREDALWFVCDLMNAPIERIAIENPVGAINSRVRKPDQIVQPWWFGDPYPKATCLWLKNLPELGATDIVNPTYWKTIHWEAPGPDRWRNRSRTPSGIARAMAEQWG